MGEDHVPIRISEIADCSPYLFSYLYVYTLIQEFCCCVFNTLYIESQPNRILNKVFSRRYCLASSLDHEIRILAKAQYSKFRMLIVKGFYYREV